MAELRLAIVVGRFAAGERLIEKNLEAEYGVSRTVVREALRQLESERLVEIVPNIGPQVRALSPEDVVHLYQVRSALESAACQLAAQSATDGQVDALRLAYKQLSERAATMTTSELIGEKNAFYEVLIEASGNPIIGEMLSNVQARISQLRAITLSYPQRTPKMLVELGEVVAAIEARDPVAASQFAQAHVEAAAQIALGHIARTAAAGQP